MKVYTATFYTGNYGSVLQAFALQQKLNEVGLDPVIVTPTRRDARRKEALPVRIKAFLKPEKHYGTVKKIRRYIETKLFKEKSKKLNRFIADHIKTEAYEAFQEYSQSHACILLSGSDQIWNILNGPIDDFFLFKNIDSPLARRISYAASIGLSELTNEQIQYFRDILKDYDVVSIREKNAYDTLKNALPYLNIRYDIDPTLLYTGEWWKKYASERIIRERYIFVYVLRPDSSLIRMAKRLAKKHKCKVLYTGQFADHYLGVKTVMDTGVEDFLSYILYADFVVTNSFHGTVFSLLFGKRFINIKIESTSSRAENLLNMVGLRNRMISSIEQLNIIEQEYSCADVESQIDKYRESSLKYIEDISNQL